jgi:hypothetical protein
MTSFRRRSAEEKGSIGRVGSCFLTTRSTTSVGGKNKGKLRNQKFYGEDPLLNLLVFPQTVCAAESYTGFTLHNIKTIIRKITEAVCPRHR